ncbi:enoyl-CoA hydratase [Vibrio galatheae]|uniref:3-hydroxyisobutyryl-CoA hydrolase n=1 Tax=Vibrio galatheae TaxID=579748 RepID=A0A0F4NP73_9VIBR|nr:enoyl-CoA hydratase/isomerase family protein [Vibrio galatheae]KJY84684.1 enoyl-CoA hydratase [Vibrio galatheae]
MSGSVQFSELPCSDSEHKIAVATLDNADSLNALSLNMLKALKQQLTLWHEDDAIVCVLIEGTGNKAFCAGGDVRTMYHVMRDASDDEITDFCCEYFTLEYQCDYLIHTYCKPIVAWGEGIVMGGGMGLYMGSSHKVVTPSSRLAMPEISIGLYPDVGATWFLNRLDQGVGLFLGLTGMMVNATDALSLHLADHLVLPEHKAMLLQQLQVADWECVDDEYEVVTEMLEAFQAEAHGHQPDPQISPYLSQIQTACQADSVIQVVDSINAIVGNEAWLATAKSNLTSGSPITAHICYRQMTQYHHLSLADCFRLELDLSLRCALLGEFREGVRSRLIDKDNQPNWRFKHVAQVDEKVIDSLFTSLWQQDSHPLSQLGHY